MVSSTRRPRRTTGSKPEILSSCSAVESRSHASTLSCAATEYKHLPPHLMGRTAEKPPTPILLLVPLGSAPLPLCPIAPPGWVRGVEGGGEPLRVMVFRERVFHGERWGSRREWGSTRGSSRSGPRRSGAGGGPGRVLRVGLPGPRQAATGRRPAGSEKGPGNFLGATPSPEPARRSRLAFTRPWW